MIYNDILWSTNSRLINEKIATMIDFGLDYWDIKILQLHEINAY